MIEEMLVKAYHKLPIYVCVEVPCLVDKNGVQPNLCRDIANRLSCFKLQEYQCLRTTVTSCFNTR